MPLITVDMCCIVTAVILCACVTMHASSYMHHLYILVSYGVLDGVCNMCVVQILLISISDIC